MTVYSTYKDTAENSINISYKGTITFDFVDIVLDILLNRLESGEEDVKTRMRVFSILTECLQNLCNYVDEGGIPPVKGDSVFFMLSTFENHYEVVTGNYVHNHKVEKMKERLVYLHHCSKEELKKEYNKVLINDTFTEKGGGGLGFIDIAKKTNQQFDFGFTPVDDDMTFFEFNIRINRITQ